MNAYVMTRDSVHVVGHARWLEVHPEQVVIIRAEDPERRPLAAVRLSDAVWVALGDDPPTVLQVPPQAADRWAPAASVPQGGEGGWPPEPPPDVDSES